MRKERDKTSGGNWREAGAWLSRVQSPDDAGIDFISSRKIIRQIKFVFCHFLVNHIIHCSLKEDNKSTLEFGG